jgi:hypothetical protein
MAESFEGETLGSDEEFITKRPKDTLFRQRRLRSWSIDFSPYSFPILIICVAILILPLGGHFKEESASVYQNIIQYDGPEGDFDCSISERNAGKACTATFTFDQDVEGPLYVYYQLKNFYQNHRRYFQSRSLYQLSGQRLDFAEVELDCNPLIKNGSQLLNPCGLIASTYFNDVFEVNTVASSSPFVMDESDIAIPSDMDTFKQVNGFKYVLVPNAGVQCADVDLPDGCQYYYEADEAQGYLYWYPDDDTVQYLHETFPGQISPIKGVTDEHFIVWMRVAGFPTFRKLYGRIHGDFKAGDVLTFNITANFEVDSFEGKKYLVVSQMGELNGRNAFPGVLLLTAGTFMIIIGFLFLFVELTKVGPEWFRNGASQAGAAIKGCFQAPFTRR